MAGKSKIAFWVCSALLVSVAHAATITDVALVGGVDAIDPAGSETIDISATNTTPQSTLASLSTFAAIHNFSGVAAGTNTFVFTDPARADVQISFYGSAVGSSAGSNINLAARASSGSDAIVLANASTSTNNEALTVTIAFGTYADGHFARDQSVQAAGFVLVNALSATSYTVNFLDLGGNLLCSQYAQGASTDTSGGQTGYSTGVDIYFGYQATEGTSIGAIVIQRNNGSGMGNTVSTIDDIGFTTAVPAPEPSALGMIAVGGWGLIRRYVGRSHAH